MKVLDLKLNVKILYLPVKTSEVFPNLLSYQAAMCGIKAISRENFFGLSQLKQLSLYNNSIETIPNNVFEGLTSLEMLSLCKKIFTY
jgi:Leucine-rich repeat (LRR) protein